MIRIVIADDHAMVRGGLKQIIATTTDIAVVGEATDAAEVLALVLALAPALVPAQERAPGVDLLLLDMKMPGPGGIELIARLRELRPALPILVLSMHNEAPIVGRALRAGARGYVTKDSEPEILLQAIRKLAGGGKFIDPALVETMVFDGENQVPLPHERLSARELQVLRLVAVGRPLGVIAEQLHLSPKTVSTHKTRLMEKLDLHETASLVRYAIRNRIVEA